jgi:hypothetical protein
MAAAPDRIYSSPGYLQHTNCDVPCPPGDVYLKKSSTFLSYKIICKNLKNLTDKYLFTWDSMTTTGDLIKKTNDSGIRKGIIKFSRIFGKGSLKQPRIFRGMCNGKDPR